MTSIANQKKEFLDLYCFQAKTYKQIAEQLKISAPAVVELFKATEIERSYINKAKQLYNSRKGRTDFKFKDFTVFYEWYNTQPKSCFYCGISEEKLAAIFDFENGIIGTSRGRGRTLELERIKTSENENIYSAENCSLACYVCNNHKSDLISAEDFKHYFTDNIRNYLEDKYSELMEKYDTGAGN